MKRPQYGLRTLLIFIAAGVVLCWAYWIGWPRWQIHREQMNFVTSLTQLKAGISTAKQPRLAWNKDHSEKQMDEDLLIHFYKLPNAMYCVCYKLPRVLGVRVDEIRSVSVKVFQLPPPPENYQPKTYRGRLPQTFFVGPISIQKQISEGAFMGDFLTAITDGQTEINDFPCELIYSDPPAPTQPPR
jgi:hypothetical protein